CADSAPAQWRYQPTVFSTASGKRQVGDQPSSAWALSVARCNSCASCTAAGSLSSFHSPGQCCRTSATSSATVRLDSLPGPKLKADGTSDGSASESPGFAKIAASHR